MKRQPLSRIIVPPPRPGLDMGAGYGWVQSAAIRAGDYVFVSGVVAVDAESGERLNGTLTSEAPVKTVESYWPYATTLFDYVKRSMPFTAPGSLSDEQVYSVVAYILGEANILPKNAAVNASSLPNIAMPNRNGFVPDPRPELFR